MIEVKNISKKYGSKTVLENISLKIPKGKITSFIGSNGAGKSTLLSVICRLISKDSGEIYVDNKEISQYKSEDLAKKISILRQENHLNLRLTIRDLVSFGRFPYSQGKLDKEDEDHIDHAIKYMNLTSIQNKYLDQLSGGQRQRAYIAMTIAQDTEYIFLDEPLNNLDMKHSVQIMKTLEKLVAELGKTICIVIHDINFASCYSDYLVALKDGQIICEGTSKELIHPDSLREIYDMDITIEKINDQKICVYYS
ncbi:iron ABC transporter ATP-binding protein [Thermoactinomyces mirandus]|uniref:ABC transporter ATP-binding protein n=1 Tax=Thermoactinomyces mirandus TaxID=2756294 RepID=A0A7W2AR67_9BACL|nr:ABC transporter ATP-binding protein [Thermoactinomyces mirandus]MBA4602243.1 ABC transporter ATP-binding protein [Thermoactinomyces mirandus]